jgi:hypothetical protein
MGYRPTGRVSKRHEIPGVDTDRHGDFDVRRLMEDSLERKNIDPRFAGS